MKMTHPHLASGAPTFVAQPRGRSQAVLPRRNPNLKNTPWPTSVPSSARRPDTDDTALRQSNASAFQRYMREVCQVDLLTPDEEIALAARIRRGDDAAREEMITANLRLVVKIAREYEGLGMPLLDMINEGNIGLMRAVEKFDPAKGGKLSTYSSWWIRQSIRRALASQARTIRLPINAIDQLKTMSRACADIREVEGREATNEELAQRMGLRMCRIAELRLAQMHMTSLDTPIGDDESSSLGEIVQDEAAIDPSERVEEQSSIDRMQQLLVHLTTRERTILEHRFGLNGRAVKTLEEIGALLGVTRERVRQLQNQALATMRQLIEENAEIQIAA